MDRVIAKAMIKLIEWQQAKPTRSISLDIHMGRSELIFTLKELSRNGVKFGNTKAVRLVDIETANIDVLGMEVEKAIFEMGKVEELQTKPIVWRDRLVKIENGVLILSAKGKHDVFDDFSYDKDRALSIGNIVEFTLINNGSLIVKDKAGRHSMVCGDDVSNFYLEHLPHYPPSQL